MWKRPKTSLCALLPPQEFATALCRNAPNLVVLHTKQLFALLFQSKQDRQYHFLYGWAALMVRTASSGAILLQWGVAWYCHFFFKKCVGSFMSNQLLELSVFIRIKSPLNVFTWLEHFPPIYLWLCHPDIQILGGKYIAFEMSLNKMELRSEWCDPLISSHYSHKMYCIGHSCI